MTNMTNDIHLLANQQKNVSYEFSRIGQDNPWGRDYAGLYLVTRIWLSDKEREYMGTYDSNSARKYWNSLVADGFVKVDKNEIV